MFSKTCLKFLGITNSSHPIGFFFIIGPLSILKFENYDYTRGSRKLHLRIFKLITSHNTILSNTIITTARIDLFAI